MTGGTGRDQRDVQRHVVHQIELRAAHRHRQPNLLVVPEVRAPLEKRKLQLRSDRRQPRDQLPRVRLHPHRHLPRHPPIQPDPFHARASQRFPRHDRRIHRRTIGDVDAAPSVEQRSAHQQQMPEPQRRFRRFAPARAAASAAVPRPPSRCTGRTSRGTSRRRDTNSAAAYRRDRVRAVADPAFVQRGAAAAGGKCLETNAVAFEQPDQRLAAPQAHRLAAKVRRAIHAVRVDVLAARAGSRRAARRRALRRHPA